MLTKLFSAEPDAIQSCVNARATKDIRPEPEQPQCYSNYGGDGGISTASASPQWLSYYAKIAPQEISRWVNPNDGSGSISYEQLVENLNTFNIPVLPMKPFASPENSCPRGSGDKDETTAGSLRRLTSPEVPSDAALTLETQGTQQEVVRSSTNKISSGRPALTARTDNNSRFLRPASICEKDCSDAVKGMRECPAAGHSGTRGQLGQSSPSSSHNDITLGSFVPRRRVDDLETTAVEQSCNTVSCTPDATRTPGSRGALRVPVSATQAMYIGPVREFRGPLSGVVDGGATRPGPYSQVPPTYVKVLNSEVRVLYDTEKHDPETSQRSRAIPFTGAGEDALAAKRLFSNNGTPPGTASSNYSRTVEIPAYNEANEDGANFHEDKLTPSRLFHKPPPIFLTPMMKTGTEKGCNEDYRMHDSSGTDDVASNRSQGEDAQSEGVTFSLGQYVWTAEDATLGTLRNGDSEMHETIARICPGAVLPAVFQPEHRSVDASRVTTKEVDGKRHGGDSQASPLKIDDLGVPSVVELCEDMKAKLRHLSGSILEYVREDVQKAEGEQEVETATRSNKGGIGGLCAARRAEKASVVFVEVPMLKAQMTPEGLWKVFQDLTDDQKTCLAMLDGCAADLSEVEALLCALHCRSLKAAGCVRPFQDFFGKMKMNAYALRGGEGWALYPHAARIKHSCQPNVAYRNVDGLLVFFALRDIPEGSPITMSYIDQLFMPTEERRKRVLACKRIFCECTRCLDPIQPERKVLCPNCRPVKLCFVGETLKQPIANQSDVAATVQGSDVDENARHSAMNHQVHAPQILDSGAHHILDMKEKRKHMPRGRAQEEAEHSGESAENHVDDGYWDSTCERETKDVKNTYSDASLSSVCSEPDREDDRIAVCDKLCIVSTAIATKREDTDGKKLAGGVERMSADGNVSDSEASLVQAENSIYENIDVAKELLKHNGAAFCDDDKDFDGNSETPCASVLDAFTSADSSGNYSSSEFSEEEQERSAKVVGDISAAEDQGTPISNEKRSTSGALTQGESTPNTKAGIYCVFEGEGCWRCSACGRQFTDNDMPVAFEIYLTGYYTSLRERLGRPTPEAWNTECGQLIRTVEKVLGAEHWLYVAGHLMLAQLYLGMWMGGLVVDVILSHALRHAALVVSSVSKPAFSAARHVDVAPLMTAVLRILLFNGRCRDFLEWVEERGALQVIRETLGTYDEVYISFSTAYVYVRQKIDEGSEPSLGLLHRFAHASQRTIALDAVYYEKKEAEIKATTARIKAAAAEETLTRQETLRQRQIQCTKRNISALKASAVSAKPKQVRDVTLTFPESIVGKYLRKYAASGASVYVTTEALRQGLGGSHGKDSGLTPAFSNASFTAAAAYEQAKRIQQMAIDGLYPAGLSPSGAPPEKDYLPLIMLADPLETSAQQLRVLHASSEAVKRERKRCEELKQTLRTTEKNVAVQDEGSNGARDALTQTTGTDEEKSFVYRIPGLSGTAPGEFVTISQINHTKDGSYPPIPFFRTFFYVDHEARSVTCRAAEDEEPPVNIKVVGCGAEGVAALTKEELDDLAAARYNFLHREAERMNREARSILVFEMGRRAQEAAAAMDSTKAFDGRKGVSNEGVNGVLPVDIIQEVNKAVRDVAIQDAHTVHRIEQFRETRNLEDAEGCGRELTRENQEESTREEQGDRCARHTADQSGPGAAARSSLAGTSVSAIVHDGPARPVSELTAPKQRLMMRCEIKNIPECFVGTESVQNFVNSGDPSEQLFNDSNSDRTVTRDQTMKYDQVTTGYARRFLKPLDFSHVPPPPFLPACASSPIIALHSQYKLARAIGRNAWQQLQNPPSRLVVAAVQNTAFAVPPVPSFNTPKPPNVP